MYSSRRKSKQSYRKRVASRKNKTRSKRKNLKFRRFRGGGPLSFEAFVAKLDDLQIKASYADLDRWHGPFGNQAADAARKEVDDLWQRHPEHREQYQKLKQDEKQRMIQKAKEEAATTSAAGAGALTLTPEEKRLALEKSERLMSNPNFDPYDCFGPNGNVKLMNGESKKISEINVGDAVETVNGFNTVVLVKTGKKHNLCVVNNVVITNRHPIKLNGKWCYPEDIVPVDPNEMNVYNFELERKDNFDENDHTIIIDGLICATLGCGPYIENAKPEADKKWGSGYWNKYNS